MSLRTSGRLVFLLATMSICTTVLHADLLRGSLPFAGFSLTENSTTLLTSTMFMALDSVTSGPGEGDFSIVPIMTHFGPFSLDETVISTGGGFSVSNATFGSFAATGGSIQHETPNALVANLTGIYDPGPAFTINGFTATPAHATLAYTQSGSSISASFTLAMIPEPATMVTMGIGLCASALVLRRKLARS